ncbi:MAG: IS3 family transposase [Ignavibacteriales bacterium]
MSDEQVKEWICELIEGEGYAYGYLKLTVCLRRRYGLVINKKKVYRLCKELRLLRPQRKIRPKHPKRLARNREVTGPNQLWEADVKYGYVQGVRRFFFVLSLLDVYDRSVVYSYIGLSATAEDAPAALGHAPWKRRLMSESSRPILRTTGHSLLRMYSRLPASTTALSMRGCRAGLRIRTPI